MMKKGVGLISFLNYVIEIDRDNLEIEVDFIFRVKISNLSTIFI